MGDGDDGGDNGMGPSQRRGKKRSRQEAAGGLEEEAISAGSVQSLTQLVARVFARRRTQQMSRGELLEGINAELAAGEDAFEGEEFEAGLAVMEGRNKIFVVEESG